MEVRGNSKKKKKKIGCKIVAELDTLLFVF